MLIFLKNWRCFTLVKILVTGKRICELGLCATDFGNVNDQQEFCFKWQYGRVKYTGSFGGLYLPVASVFILTS